ncbi:MAG: toprim domain-containing protein [Candidatus Peribacteraceae bacterium]|nr:toprim domain-containing protein [Candidatus Peribacteraceae bacterium]
MSSFEEVKQALPIEKFIESVGGSITKTGHVDPSPCCGHNGCCSVNKEKKLFKCFSCDAGGSVIDLIKAHYSCSDAEALKKGAELANIELKHGFKKETKNESQKEILFRLTADYYHKNFMAKDSDGRKYFIEARGHSEATAIKMKAGLTDGKLIKYLEKNGFTLNDMVKNGLVRTHNKEGKELKAPSDYFFKGLIVFPVVDFNGRILSFTSKDPTKKYRGLLLKGIEKNFFINHPALGRDDLFVVEGENDVASLMDCGIDNVVGTIGAPSVAQIKLLQNFSKNKTILLWFDHDEPNQDDHKKRRGGAAHIFTIYKYLKDSDVKVDIIDMSTEYKDPDEFIRAKFNEKAEEKRTA